MCCINSVNFASTNTDGIQLLACLTSLAVLDTYIDKADSAQSEPTLRFSLNRCVQRGQKVVSYFEIDSVLPFSDS